MNWSAYANVRDIVLFALTIYATVLSTLNFVQSRRKDRRSVRVVCSTVMPTYGAELGPPHMKIEAINDGHRVVTISTLTLELPDKSRMAAFVPTVLPSFPDTPLPARLEQGDVAHRIFRYADIGSALVFKGITTKTKLTPVCEDTVRGRYYGEPWDIDPTEFMQMGQS